MRFKHGSILVLVIAVFFSAAVTPEATAVDSVGELTEIARLGRGWIGGLSWTADGDAILAASMSGVWRYGLDGSEAQVLPPSGTQIGPQYVMDMADDRLTVTTLPAGAPLAFQPELVGYTLAVFSPDQTRLALADSASLRLWSLPGGTNVNSIALESLPVRGALSFSADNRLFAAAFTVRRENAQPGEPFDREDIRIWDAATGDLVTTLSTDGLDRLVTGLAFSADNRTLVAGRIGGVTVYDVASGDYRRFNLPDLPADNRYGDMRVLDGVVYGKGDRWVAAAWVDLSPGAHMAASVTVWDAQTGQIISALDGLHGFTLGLTASPDGSRIALYSYEGTVLAWDLAGAPQIVTDQHPAGADRLAVYGDTLAVGGFDRAVRLWSLPDRALTATLFEHSSDVQAVTFNPDGLLASASRFDTWTWSLETGVQDVDVVAADALALGFAGEALHGVVSVPGSASSVWAASAQGIERTELSISGVVAAIAGGRIAVHTLENMVLFDLAGKELARFLPGTIVRDLSFSPDAGLLLVGGGDRLSLWSVEADPTLVWAVETDSPVSALAFGPDGSRIALGAAGGALEVRSVDDGALISAAPFKGTLADVIFSPDGESVIAAIDTQIVIWNVE